MPKKPNAVFPTWLRKLDPTLAWEDENMLFQTFVELRNRRSIFYRVLPFQGLFLPFLFKLGFVVSIIIALFPRAFFLINSLFSLLLYAVFYIVFAFLISQILLRYRKTRINIRIPSEIRLLFLGGYEKLLLELWVTPLTGKEIAQALYLEWRMKHVFTPFMLPLFIVFLAAIPLFSIDRSLGTFQYIFALCGMIFLFYYCVGYFLALETEAAAMAIREKILRWDFIAKKNSLNHFIDKYELSSKAAIFFLSPLFASVWLCACFSVFAIVGVENIGYTLSCILLTTALVFSRIWRTQRDGLIKICKGNIDASDLAYQCYMIYEVIQDHDVKPETLKTYQSLKKTEQQKEMSIP